MPRYVDWFLVEAERRLRGTLGPEELHQTLGEVEEHLSRDLQNGLDQGMPENKAELAAIHRFGSPVDFAKGVWREQANAIFGRPADRVATWLGWGAFGCVALIGIAVGRQWLGLVQVLLLIALAIAPIFLVAAFRSRRWIVGRTMPAFAATAVLLFLFLGFGFVKNLGGMLLSRSAIPKTIEDMERAATRLERDSAALQEMSRAYLAANTPDQVPAQYRFGTSEGEATALRLGAKVAASGFMRPTEFGLGQAGDQSVTTATVVPDTFPAARTAWKSIDYQGRLGLLDSQAKHLHEDIAKLQKRAKSTFAFEPDVAIVSVYIALWPLAILALLNGVALVASSRLRAKPWTVALSE